MNKFFEWIYRIICFTILQSLISLVGFVSIYYGMQILIEQELVTTGVKIGIIQAALAICLLQIANFVYWFFGKNIFNFRQEDDILEEVEYEQQIPKTRKQELKENFYPDIEQV